VLNGRCHCGAVRYRVDDAFRYAAYCHCSNCRTRTGSAFSSFGGIERSKIEIVEGQNATSTFGDTDKHTCFCKICGTTLFAVFGDPAMAHVQLGTLIDAPGIKPGEHIFVGSKAPWYEICDSLPQYEAYSG
jgi:hypothetical protein